jgi:hypothetical protein
MPIRLDYTPNGEEATPIVMSEISKMVTNYKDSIPEWETKSAWVSVSEVLELIAHNNANGIRILFGRHRDHPDYGNQQTVILVATRDSHNLDKPTTQKSRNLLNPDAKKGKVDKVIVSYKDCGDDSVPLCPPACPEEGPNP